ncbi:MAG: alpha/beta family hydrolase [Acidimicrobiia bacterium]
MTATTWGRRLRIAWRGEEKITAVIGMHENSAPVGVLLAPGAGAGQHHPFLVTLRRGLVRRGIVTMTFDYPYAEAGRRAPDRPPTLLDAHRAAAQRLLRYVPDVVLAGKSMGGRVGSHLAGDEAWPAAGLVYYGYPLVPPGREARPVDHLERIEAPQLFFAGSRDRLSPVAQISSLVRTLTAATLVTVPDGDHSFRVPRRSEVSTDEVLRGLIDTTADWILGPALQPQPGAGT